MMTRSRKRQKHLRQVRKANRRRIEEDKKRGMY